MRSSTDRTAMPASAAEAAATNERVVLLNGTRVPAPEPESPERGESDQGVRGLGPGRKTEDRTQHEGHDDDTNDQGQFVVRAKGVDRPPFDGAGCEIDCLLAECQDQRRCREEEGRRRVRIWRGRRPPPMRRRGRTRRVRELVGMSVKGGLVGVP